ncbi:MAG: hypothetical protein ACREPC_08440 [Stenotrophomonas sp.]|uniref:hypothetical protein n=1 Tax=Stenotrophomonas sp. TaxID=69392 RepID=UPI003D6CAA7F
MYPEHRKRKFPAPLLADWLFVRLGHRDREKPIGFMRACLVHALSFLLTWGPLATAAALLMTDASLLKIVSINTGGSLLYGAMVASARPRGRR